MKSIVLSSIVAAFLVFGGCSSKDVAVDSDTADNKPAALVEQENIVVEQESIVNSDTNDLKHMSMSDIESELSTVYFGFDQFSIDSEAQAVISKASALGKEGASQYNVKLEGNCDEWGSDEYNFALGLKRANSVKKALVAEGIEGNRISMVSYGKSNPVCNEKTQDCYAQNRRVDFKLLP